MPPIFWYHLSEHNLVENLEKIIKLYNPKIYKIEYDNVQRAFIGTKDTINYSIQDIQTNIVLNKHSELNLPKIQHFYLQKG